MSTQELAVANLLTSKGFKVVIRPNALGRSNGGSWHGGAPSAPLLHHFVCSLNPDQAYIEQMVQMLERGYDATPGPVVNWFIDMHGVFYLIADGPANHSGMGNSSVLARLKSDQPPLGPAAIYANTNDFNGNEDYVGAETQHPGDATPYPDALLNSMAAFIAAHAVVYQYSTNRGVMHYEHTNRKDDPSWEGGPSTGQGGKDFRAKAAALIASWSGNTPTPPVPPNDDWDDMDQSTFNGLLKNALADPGVAAQIGDDIWKRMIGNGGAGAILEEIRETNRTILANTTGLKK